jgi:amidophosphoribosyltransferase
MIFDGLTVLQHRGQDAAGICTAEAKRLHLRKDNGLVKDVFQTNHMIELRGNIGVGHVRYPTAGSSSCAEAQPLYTNYPFGISLVHNGNLTNTEELRAEVVDESLRHMNTDSDSELLLNLFAEELTKRKRLTGNFAADIFHSMEAVMRQCRGGYSGVYLVNGVGLVGFRDPNGIRPLVFGSRPSSKASSTTVPTTPKKMSTVNQSLDYCFSSESVAVDTLGFKLIRDIAPGECIFIGLDGNVHTKICSPTAKLTPCIFEYVYFARPDSIMDGVSVYETRLNMGVKLAQQIKERYADHDIDVVIPIPDTSRTSALQAAYVLGRPFREGFIKNRYIARTFIMPGQETRKKSVRLKLNTIKSEFAGRNVLLVDDSVVRGTTAREIVAMARDAGAKKVYFCSAAPPIRYPNIYGIDIPTRQELVAYEREEHEIAEQIGADWIVYQKMKDLEDSITECIPEESPIKLSEFDTSCFTGTYVTGEKLGDAYFTRLHEMRNDDAQHGSGGGKPIELESVKLDYLNRRDSSGCEAMVNDMSITSPKSDSCEPIVNPKA